MKGLTLLYLVRKIENGSNIRFKDSTASHNLFNQIALFCIQNHCLNYIYMNSFIGINYNLYDKKKLYN